MRSPCGAKTRRDDLLLPFGELPDGSIVHVDAVPGGLACGCICPGCAGRLVARKGTVKEHHFAHHGTPPCGGSYETALHKLAKQILNRELRLMLPEIAAGAGSERVVEREGGVFTFERAELEVAFAGFQPDVVLHRGDRRLLVEVLVTHPTGEEKVERIASAGLSAIEIDLSHLPRAADITLLTDEICFRAPRWWLANPRLIRAQERLEEKRRGRARVAAARAEADRQRAEAEHRRREAWLARRAKRIAAALIARPDPYAETAEERAVRVVGLGAFLDQAVPGDGCFRVPRVHWQSQVLHALVLGPMAARSYGPGPHAIDLFKVLRGADLIRPEMPAYIAPEEELALAIKVPGFVAPYAVLQGYLRRLCGLGLLLERRKRWHLTDRASAGLADIKERSERARTRTDQLKSTVARILDGLPDAERAGLTVEQWFEGSCRGDGLTPAAAVLREEGDALLRIATAIKSMLFAQGPIVTAWIGLPVREATERERQRRAAAALLEEQQARERAAAERARAAEQAARAREQRREALAAAAGRDLAESAAAWLSEPLGAGQDRTPDELAALSDDGLGRARAALAAAAEQRRRREDVAALRDQLAAAARGSGKPDHAHLFLHSANPRFGGMRPIDYCVDKQTLAAVLLLMKEVTRR